MGCCYWRTHKLCLKNIEFTLISMKNETWPAPEPHLSISIPLHNVKWPGFFFPFLLLRGAELYSPVVLYADRRPGLRNDERRLRFVRRHLDYWVCLKLLCWVVMFVAQISVFVFKFFESEENRLRSLYWCVFNQLIINLDTFNHWIIIILW